MMTKREVIDHLTIQINTKGDRFLNSKYKWQSDIDWLQKVEHGNPEKIRYFGRLGYMSDVLSYKW